MYQGLAIFTSAVLIISPFSLPTLAAQNLRSPSNFSSSPESSTMLAQNNRARRIDFAAGASAAVVNGSVVRGNRSIYVLGASRGQTMVITIDSTMEQGGALFDVISPNGEIISSGASNFRQSLLQSGDYRIIVGGSRGNASFDLTVSIN